MLKHAALFLVGRSTGDYHGLHLLDGAFTFLSSWLWLGGQAVKRLRAYTYLFCSLCWLYLYLWRWSEHFLAGWPHGFSSLGVLACIL